MKCFFLSGSEISLESSDRSGDLIDLKDIMFMVTVLKFQTLYTILFLPKFYAVIS